MVQTPSKPLTLEDFLQQPDTKPASEYIDGQIIQKPMPKADHGIVQTDLATAINTVLKQNKQGRAIAELRCTFGDRSIVPDITVLPWSAIPRNENGKASGELFAAPEWMIEILSQGQSQTKVVKKILHALEHGTQIGWLIDPAEDCVFSYTPDLRTVLHEEATTKLPVPAFAEGFELTVGELIAWLYE
ncbi:Uma2 family endonuclease [Leptolyngbya sp. BC1307]|uniref:Uma2 family endonuclease n=1 Tax=Leptolyngbya sp. BC1307 TaxID=2029589 RepID=UPI000EFB68F7|nr:Uma2 family endonuclease [Leptolyngbya sp. BC1307]